MRYADRPNERVRFDVVVDGEVVLTDSADQFGDDLLNAGLGDGRHRFAIALGDVAALRSGSMHEVVVREIPTRTVVFRERLTRWRVDELETTPIVDVFAHRYLCGVGLEIGALNRPQKLPLGATSRHVDLLSTKDLCERYGEVAPADVVNVEIVDDGATLHSVADQSADFLIANNVLEHVQDPIRTLGNWHRVVRHDGVLLLVIPNPRNSVDRDRAMTTSAHLIADFVDGPQHSQRDHYRDWVVAVERRPADEVEGRTIDLERSTYPIHFHVWDELGCAELVRATVALTGRKFAVEHLALTPDRMETVMVLRVA